jgi:MazG family protein
VSAIERLVEIMTRLRDPQRGCPWDVEQTFETIAPYTIEEAYEVDDAIRRGDLDALRDELGDLLLQVVFHAQMAREAGHFDFEGVAQAICDKLVRRHPHVFGDAEVRTAAQQLDAWEEQKARERAAAHDEGTPSALDGVAQGYPALLRAQKLQRRAERAGLPLPSPGWDDALAAFSSAFSEDAPNPEREHVTGALLFAVARIANTKGVDAEQALREATARFESAMRAAERDRAAGS